MTSPGTFQCAVITPERKVLDTPATFVAFPAHDGEMGVLTRRAPLVCKLGIGLLRVEAPAEKHTLFIDGGFAQVLDDQLTILTQQARKPSELDAASAEQALVEARALKITDEASYTARANAMQRARIQLRITGSTE